ncbi:hypothetical protein N1851_033725 [Merluccius polli]|uniref:Uncharacterized protein n=1 Tax=Merluccius polli TaxID=89951 RepID=A0AA47M0U3_MERPO|nr:hypothetical protein N1851_033725 [Merluccius polli]
MYNISLLGQEPTTPWWILLHDSRVKCQSVATQPSILHCTNNNLPLPSPSGKLRTKPRACQYCNSLDHSIIKCKELKDLRTENVIAWIKQKRRCWRCAGPHMAMNGNLKKPCPLCNGKNLGILHHVNQRKTDSKVLYLNQNDPTE